MALLERRDDAMALDLALVRGDLVLERREVAIGQGGRVGRALRGGSADAVANGLGLNIGGNVKATMTPGALAGGIYTAGLPDGPLDRKSVV